MRSGETTLKEHDVDKEEMAKQSLSNEPQSVSLMDISSDAHVSTIDAIAKIAHLLTIFKIILIMPLRNLCIVMNKSSMLLMWNPKKGKKELAK